MRKVFCDNCGVEIVYRGSTIRKTVNVHGTEYSFGITATVVDLDRRVRESELCDGCLGVLLAEAFGGD